MKSTRKYKIILIIVIFFLAIWRLWPHSFKKIIPLNYHSVSEINLQMTEFGTSNSSLSMDVYKLDIESVTDVNYDCVLNILNGTKYRPDFRNLLPLDITTVDSGSKSITHSAIIRFIGNESDEVCYINFHGDNTVSVDSKYASEFRIYHLMNRKSLYELAEYIKQNGTN